ncbi:MAG: DUF554 domain-containing protein [Anaerolineae bacterium]|nr:DUF554 domain-containing protein [Anaerolineae bacterium]
MGGAILNIIAVLAGSGLGLLIGSRLPARVQESVVFGLGLVTLFVGLDNARLTGNVIIPLLSVASGVIIGELVNIQAGLERLGGWLQRRFTGNTANAAATSSEMDSRTRFITGFVTASLVFCVGPLTFLGSIQDGMGLPVGFQQIAIKSALDFFASMAFATSFGVGVMFSAGTILLVQGGLALLGMGVGAALQASPFYTPMINEMTATGGLLLVGLATILLGLKQPRMANFLPALVIAPLIVAIAGALGINLYPF